ncbi:hypothetical protein LCM4579_24960 [Ensifer sp. LCM 4579]|nr:hypothetical protein LCM4579_24960 [Ensifer sp. LCM 4579]
MTGPFEHEPHLSEDMPIVADPMPALCDRTNERKGDKTVPLAGSDIIRISLHPALTLRSRQGS